MDRTSPDVIKEVEKVLLEDGNELVLPKTEQIPSDFFRKGDTVKAVIISVEMKNNTPIITLSRTSNLFLERLFEQEVPEIFDGLITIKKVARMCVSLVNAPRWPWSRTTTASTRSAPAWA